MFNMKLSLLVALGCVLMTESRGEPFTISGTLYCRGNKIGGKITMVDDNFWVFDHLLNERTVGDDGKFRLVGEPEDDDLNVQLIIEHSCHQLLIGKHGKKIEAFSVFSIKYSDILKSEMNLEKDIELSEGSLTANFPSLHVWKTFIYGKRIISDNANRIYNLPFWKYL